MGGARKPVVAAGGFGFESARIMGGARNERGAVFVPEATIAGGVEPRTGCVTGGAGRGARPNSCSTDGS
jgi:hypothetical protein